MKRKRLRETWTFMVCPAGKEPAPWEANIEYVTTRADRRPTAYGEIREIPGRKEVMGKLVIVAFD